MEKSRRPLRNIRLTLEYDGAGYLGWQAQARGKTVQTAIEEAIRKILGKRSPVVASGRTDSGVHALAQVANVRGHFPMDDATLLRALNSMLPPDIAVTEVRTMPAAFHAQKDAKWKKYRYQIHNSAEKSALARGTSWHVIAPLDIKGMRKAARHLTGRHDFASFMAAHSSVKSSVRNVFSLEIKRRGKTVVIEITADGFLRQMVRNIAGTLVEVGRGRIKPEAMRGMLEARDRRRAGPTAPPQGLFLVEVGY